MVLRTGSVSKSSSGITAADALYSIQLAKDSFSRYLPPCRGHQVAEPLMRQFMRLHRQVRAPLLQRRILVEQQQPLAEG